MPALIAAFSAVPISNYFGWDKPNKIVIEKDIGLLLGYEIKLWRMK